MNKVRVVDNVSRVKREEDDVNRVWEEHLVDRVLDESSWETARYVVT